MLDLFNDNDYMDDYWDMIVKCWSWNIMQFSLQVNMSRHKWDY